MYLFVTVIAVFLSGYLFKHEAGSISIYKLNMISWIYYYDFILLTVIGAVLVVYEIDHHYMIDKLSYNSSRITGFWAILYAFVFFPVGIKCANFLFGVKNIKTLFEGYIAKPLQFEKKYNDQIIRLILLGISCICILSVFYVLYTLGEIPLLKFFSASEAFNFAEFRISVSRGFQGNEYVKNLLAIVATPLMSYVAYGYKLRDKTFFSKI